MNTKPPENITSAEKQPQVSDAAAGSHCKSTERRPVDYGDFSEYQVRCLLAEYCRNITIGNTGWGVSFIEWLDIRGIAKHEGRKKLTKLEDL